MSGGREPYVAVQLVGESFTPGVEANLFLTQHLVADTPEDVRVLPRGRIEARCGGKWVTAPRFCTDKRMLTRALESCSATAKTFKCPTGYFAVFVVSDGCFATVPFKTEAQALAAGVHHIVLLATSDQKKELLPGGDFAELDESVSDD